MLECPWRVLHVNTNHEKRVARFLVARSVEHYLPLYAKASRWSDRSVILERPLFAGYLFVRFSPQERRSVISTPGVLRLLGDHERDTISAAEIDRIRAGLTAGCLLRPHDGVSAGTRVRVRGGAFEGVEGVVTELHHPCRVIIALAAIQRSFSLDVGLDDVEVLNGTVANPVRGRYLRMPAEGTTPESHPTWLDRAARPVCESCLAVTADRSTDPERAR